MNVKHWLIGIAGALALGFMASASQAAPVSGVTGGLKAAAGDTSNVEKAHWRHRCGWYRGHRHCRRIWIGGGYYPYYAYGGYPYVYGPSIGFYFGGHRHHHRHWR